MDERAARPDDRPGGWIRALPPLILLAVGALVVRGLLRPYMVYGHSAYIDYVRQVAVDHALRTRHAFPSWVPEFYFGYGSPIFLFYAPLPYVLSGLASVLGAGPLWGIKIVYAGAVVASGFTMYGLARDLFGRWGGLASGVLYMSAPYVIANVYERSAIGEVLAMALAPALFRAVLRAGRGERAVLGGAAAAAGLVLAHNIAALLLVPAAVAYAALCAIRARSAVRTAALAALLAAGLGLSAFFWFPALAEKREVHAEQGLTSGFFDYRRHFVTAAALVAPYSDPEAASRAWKEGQAPRVGLLHLAVALLGLALVLRRRSPARGDALFFAGLAATAVFFMLPVSAGLWARVPLIRFVQFPWRFLIPFTLAASVLGGAVVAETVAGRRSLGAVLCAALVIGAPILSQRATRVRYLVHDLSARRPTPVDLATVRVPATWPALWITPESFLTLPNLARMGVTSTAQDDYLPIRVEKPPTSPRPAAVAVAQGEATFDGIDDRGDRLAVRLRADGPATVRLGVFDYPGWEATLDGRPAVIRPEPGSGCILVDVPPGAHDLHAAFVGSTLRRAAKGVSLVVLAILAVGAAARRRRASDGAAVRSDPPPDRAPVKAQ